MANAGTAKWGLGFGKLMVILIAILLVLGVGYIFLGLGHGANKVIPQFPNSEQPAPAAFQSVVTSTGSGITDSLAALSRSYLSNVSQFSVSYAGYLDVQGSGAESAISVSTPLYISYASYGPSRKFVINATSVSIFGDTKVAFLNLTNGTFGCANFNSTALNSGNVEGAFLGNRSMECWPGNQLAGLNLTELAFFNLAQLQQFGLQFNYTTDYQSTYRGMPCTYLAGTVGVENATTGTQTNAGSFGECFSDQYYVPLSFSMYGSGSSGSFSLDYNETAISNSASQSYVNMLP